MTPSLDQFLKDGREKKCVVPRALGKDCSDLCSCCFSFLTAIKMLRRAVEALEFYGHEFSWSEEYIGGPRLNFSGLEGEGFEKAKQALSDLEQMANGEKDK